MDIEELKADFEQSECFKRLEHVAQYTFFEFGAYIKRTDVPADIEKKCGKLITALLFSWSAWKEAKAQAAPKWISVEINSPNPHDQVLAFTNQNGTNIFETLFLDEFKDWKTTHWMPLPTSPLEQNK